LAPTDPFAAGAGTSGVGLAGPQSSAAPANADPAKAAAIQSLRQAQANPQARQKPRKTARVNEPAADSFPKLESPSPEDIANGNYIKVGFRHLLRDDPGKIFYHTYVLIPRMEEGKPVFDSYGVLGNPNSAKGENQQVRKNDRDPRWRDTDRNSQVPNFQGKEVLVKVTPEQREALRERMEYFSEQDEKGDVKHPCPVCGSDYKKLGPNSNEFIYNMLFWNLAGLIPAPKLPSRFFTPAYYVNDPNKEWYPNSSN